MKKQKGFTIIELIVVIAIIAVLAGIVLVNVQSYIAKSKVAALKGSMKSLQVAAAVFIEANPTLDYSSFLTNTATPTGNPKAVEICNAMKKIWAGGTSCGVFTPSVDGKKYCHIMAYSGSSVGCFCVDSAGGVVETSGNCPSTCTPAATSSCN